jgi:hypothetical protein
LAWRFSQIADATGIGPSSISNSSRETNLFFGVRDVNINWLQTGYLVRQLVEDAIESIPGHKKRIDSRDAHPSEMQNSELCIAAHGVFPTTSALISALRRGCMPIVVSDTARFPFEELFVNYGKILGQVSMDDPKDLGAKVSMLNDRVSARARVEMREIDGLLEEKGMNVNEQKWGWAWMQYIKAVVTSSVLRRKPLRKMMVLVASKK